MNKRAFTLIEILAVIIILGIIALVVVPVSSRYIFNTRKTVYEEHESSLEDEAKNMTTECLLDNKVSCKIPVGSGSRRVFLSELIEDGYIDELKNPRSDSYCNKDLSFVVINKNGLSEYDYKICLICDEYTTDMEMCKGDYGIDIWACTNGFHTPNGTTVITEDSSGEGDCWCYY